MEWFRAHAAEFSGRLLWDEPLSKHTYYRIGGPATLVAFPKSKADLHWLKRGLALEGVPWFFLGQGSNLLVSDHGFLGCVIRASQLDLGMELQGERLRTGASVAISSLLRRASTEGWGGLEFLTGIPGSVGGAIAMNAGTHLGEVAGAAVSVEAFGLAPGLADELTFEAPLAFDYRRNLFLPPGALVTGATWRIRLEAPAEVKTRIDETLQRRKATQPIDFPSCGSVFKNPRDQGLSAWQVVDRLGLRGYKLGGAQVSEKHPNFIINLGDARASDVAAIIHLIKSRAESELGIYLEEEVKYLGSL